MKRHLIILSFLMLLCTSWGAKPVRLLNTGTGFIENKGQIIDQNGKLNPAVLYLLNMPGMNVQLRRDGFSYDLYSIDNSKVKNQNSKLQLKTQNTDLAKLSPSHHLTISPSDSCLRFHRIDFTLVNSNPNCKISATEPCSDYLNYYGASFPGIAILKVRQFKKVIYEDIYPKINLEFTLDDVLGYKYNFVIRPGGDISSILLNIGGADQIALFDDTLRINTELGNVNEVIPGSYFQAENSERIIKAGFCEIMPGLWGFTIRDNIPENTTLVIDPTSIRINGTYYGGISTETGTDETTDSQGNVIITGTTLSDNNIATSGAYQSTYLPSGFRGYVAKFNTNGIRLWGSYLEGSYNGSDEIMGCATDLQGNIYLGGITSSDTGIATPGAHQTTYGGGVWDIFLAKFTADGARVWATYYGGQADDETWAYGKCISMDKYGNVYICGQTGSDTGIASPGAYQPVINPTAGTSGFLAKFDSNGVRLWGTYYSGELSTWFYSCATDTSGKIYASGYTNSTTNIATPGTYQTVNAGGGDAFLVAFTPGGQRIWGTYFGGPQGESDDNCLTTKSGNIYMVGNTTSTTGIASPGCFQPVYGGGTDGYMAKFNSSGQVIWSTYYGGSSSDEIEGVTEGWNGNIFFSGRTQSANNISTPNSFQPAISGSSDAFLVKFDSNGQRQWGTYFGGSLWDGGYVKCNYVLDDTIYLEGGTQSLNNIATPTRHQKNYGGGISDAFLEKFIDCWPIAAAQPVVGLNSVCQSTNNVVYATTPLVHAVSYQWNIPPGAAIAIGAGTTSVTVNFSSSAVSGYISVKGLNKCGDAGDSASLYVTLHPRPVPVISGPTDTCTGPGKVYSTSPGMTNYQWSISPGGIITSGGSVSDNTVIVKWNVPGTRQVLVNYKDANGCEALAPTVMNVNVTAGPVVNVTITESSNNICAGTSVTFTATSVNGGNNPAYQWKVNGINSGTNSQTFIYNPLNGDQITCVLTSDATCSSNNPATSNSISMIVITTLPVSVSVSASANPVCAGKSVTFTAAPTNGGTNPTYQWKVNGLNVGTNNPVYTYVPSNADLVKCILSSSEACTLNNPATSNSLSMTINNNLLVGISISASANPVCGGIPVTFTATPTNGGSPPQYQWKVNGNYVGANSPNYTYIPSSGDQVSCILTSNLTCTSNNPATSNILSMTINNPPVVTFTRCFDSITITNAKSIKLKGGIPLGGTYSGPGVNPVTGYLNPAAAGIGIKTITYTYTNSALCSSSDNCSLIILNSSLLTCGNPLTDPRDGKVYPTVQIGSQCWMAANLNYGTEIPSTQHQRDNCIPEKYKSAVGSQQSAFYQWDELMRYDDTPGLQGLCPPGWHVPTENDWNTLFANYINNAFAGSPLKYSGYSGFNALLSGVRFMNKTWSFDGFATYFWSSTAHGPNKAWAHTMNDYDPSVAVYPSSRSNAFSVRCLKDN